MVEQLTKQISNSSGGNSPSKNQQIENLSQIMIKDYLGIQGQTKMMQCIGTLGKSIKSITSHPSVILRLF